MEKIKLFLESDKGKDILVIIIVILVGLGAFELGRLSKENDTKGLKIEYPSQNNDIEANVVKAQKNTEISQNEPSSNIDKYFFASSRGSKYYSLNCSAGKTIKQENRIYFKTNEEAERAGYTLASACR